MPYAVPVRVPFLALLLVAAAVPAAVAQEKEINKDFVRRALLDNCVYTMATREGVDRKSMIEACQCASGKTAREIKDSDLTGLTERSRIPDSWVQAVQASFATCRR